MQLSRQKRWCFSAVLRLELVLVLLSSLRRAHSAQFNIHYNSTTNVTLDVHLGDRVTIFCPADRFDNIVYLRTAEQLKQCNITALPSNYDSRGLPTHIDVGVCAGAAVASFNIDIRRTSEFLATSVPFQNGGTYYFTSFTEGTGSSVFMNPTAGGDCLRGLSVIVNVIDPNPTVATSLTTTTPTEDSFLSRETDTTEEPSQEPSKEPSGVVSPPPTGDIAALSVAPYVCVSSLLLVLLAISSSSLTL